MTDLTPEDMHIYDSRQDFEHAFPQVCDVVDEELQKVQEGDWEYEQGTAFPDANQFDVTYYHRSTETVRNVKGTIDPPEVTQTNETTISYRQE